ncbi:MAG: hypothetical protein ABSA79_09435 [Candidatus Bathyarchaeia archaeon]|jgi:phenylacetate-CoA ligase
MRIPYGKGIEFYSKSPLQLQKVISVFLAPIPRSMMLGSGFQAFLRELNRTQWYKPYELRKHQESRLRSLIRHAYENVPYYNRLFKQRSITPDDVKTIEDLKKIPVLTKNDLRDHFKELIAVNAEVYRYGKSRTSGSTGKPVTFYLDQQNREMEYAAKWRQRGWANVDLNSRIASFRAFRGMRGTDFQGGKPRWNYNALSKELEFNIFGLNRANLGKQVQKLREFNPNLIEGYPSVIELLAKHVLEHGYNDICPIAVQTSSESLLTRRETIEKAFGCKVFDRYGQSEYVVSVDECPAGSYHVAESGILEVIKDGEQVSDGEIGEIIGTGLCNYSMPLIRYRTTDICQHSAEFCSCGRGMPLIKSLEGRTSDIILSPDGRSVTGVSFEHYWKHVISPQTPHLDYVHVIQKADYSLIVQMVKTKGYSDEETSAILQGLDVLLGSEIRIAFEELPSIPARKKWRFTESQANVRLL